MKLKIVEFSPTQYLKLKDALKLLDYDERKSPVLALTDSGTKEQPSIVDTPEPDVESDAKVLDSHKEIQIQDAHTMVLKARYSKTILNYAGKKREAEVKIDFNPACQEAKIDPCHSHFQRRQAPGNRQRRNQCDGRRAGMLPRSRYTGGKILVANLPGIDIGSTIEVEYEITTKNKPFVSGFEAFQLPDLLEQKTVVLNAPADLKVQDIITGPNGLIQEQDQTVDGKQVHAMARAEYQGASC